MSTLYMTQPLLPNNYYHIYNRGNNRQPIFYEQGNYFYFLKKYKAYMDGYWDTLAWVLVVKVKSMDDILLRANLDFTKVERSFLRRHEKTIGVDAGDVADLAVDFKSFKTFQVFEVLPDSTPYST